MSGFRASADYVVVGPGSGAKAHRNSGDIGNHPRLNKAADAMLARRVYFVAHVWVGSIGFIPQVLGSLSADRFIQEMTALLDKALREGSRFVPEWYVAPWKAFRSERECANEKQVIVLFVGTARAFTIDEYLMGCDAVVKHEAGHARLSTVFLPGTQDLSQAPPDDDVWKKRSKLLVNKLRRWAIYSPAAWIELPSLAEALASKLCDDLQTNRFRTPELPKGLVNLFYSYCHTDEQLRDELQKHLALLEHSGLIQGWHDRRILAGDDWSDEIDANLYTADLILLLLSADFFASTYCRELEVPVALRRHEANAAVAIPIVLRPVVWNLSPLARLQALPQDARPITLWESRDAAFVNVCEGILAAVLSWRRNVGATRPSADTPDRFEQAAERRRVLDAALPQRVQVGRSAILVVVVRMASSPGLRGLVAGDITYGISEEAVQSRPVRLHFPVKAGKLQSATVRVVVHAPEFRVTLSRSDLLVPPQGDSTPLILLLTPLHSGDLNIVIEVYERDALVVACPMRTVAIDSISTGGVANISSWAFDLAHENEKDEVVESIADASKSAPQERESRGEDEVARRT